MHVKQSNNLKNIFIYFCKILTSYNYTMLELVDLSYTHIKSIYVVLHTI